MFVKFMIKTNMVSEWIKTLLITGASGFKNAEVTFFFTKVVFIFMAWITTNEWFYSDHRLVPVGIELTSDLPRQFVPSRELDLW